MPSSGRCVFGCVTEGPAVHSFPNPKKYPEQFRSWVQLAGKKLANLSVEEIYLRKKVCDKHLIECHRYRYRRLNIMPIMTSTQTSANASQESTSFPPPPEDCEIDDPPEAFDPEDSDTRAVMKLPTEETKKSGSAQTVTKDDEHKSIEPMATTESDIPRSVNQVQNTSTIIQKSAENNSYIESEPTVPPAVITAPICHQFRTKEFWKMKLNQIIHNTQFCGVCLESDVDMNGLTDVFDIIQDENTWSTSLTDIVKKLFGEGGYSPANSQICNNCTKKLIQSYLFIRNAEETSKMLNRHLDELYSKTCYVRNNSLNATNNTHPKIFKIVIALDNNFESYNIKIEPPEALPPKAKVRQHDKSKFWCVSCNVVLRSYEDWRTHEITVHRKNPRCSICLQSYKTQQALNTHYRTHLKSRCTVCYRTVEDGDLLQHLNNHKCSIHLCTTCKTAFYSAEALKAHTEQCHRRTGTKCVTCLQSMSRVELERHQCKFKCPDCHVAPCIHHQHLMCYREQVVNLAPRAKCAECSYSCTSKEALIIHVNERHLRIQPLQCFRCRQRFYKRAHLYKHVCVPQTRKRHDNVYVCWYCDKSFSNLNICKGHEKWCQVIQRKYQCDDCPANFDLSKDHMNHKKLKHAKHFLSCSLCDRVFLNDLKRIRHERQVHERGRASLVCVACHTKFPTKAALALHVRFHGAEEKGQLINLEQSRRHKPRSRRSFAVCEVCGAVIRQTLFKEHMFLHGTATVSCKTCGKSFPSCTLLKHHRSVHARTAPCPRCKTSVSSIKLWRHFREHLIQETRDIKVLSESH